jgi:hypothetical protein
MSLGVKGLTIDADDDVSIGVETVRRNNACDTRCSEGRWYLRKINLITKTTLCASHEHVACLARGSRGLA